MSRQILALAGAKKQHRKENAQHTGNRKRQHLGHGAARVGGDTDLRDERIRQNDHAQHKQGYGKEQKHKHDDATGLNRKQDITLL